MKLPEFKYSATVSENVKSEAIPFRMASGGRGGFLYEVLRSKMYADKPRATVRELVANARDAQRRNGTQDVPVVVEITEKDPLFNASEPCLVVKDCGTGMTIDKIKNVYSVYGDTDKDGGNEEYGGFGLGAKTPFSLTDSFLVRTTVDYKQSTYNCIIDKTGEGQIIPLIRDVEVEQESGTDIIVPLSSISDSYVAGIKNALGSEFLLWDVRPKIYIEGKNILEDISTEKEPFRVLSDKMSLFDRGESKGSNLIPTLTGYYQRILLSIDGYVYGVPEEFDTKLKGHTEKSPLGSTLDIPIYKTQELLDAGFDAPHSLHFAGKLEGVIEKNKMHKPIDVIKHFVDFEKEAKKKVESDWKSHTENSLRYGGGRLSLKEYQKDHPLEAAIESVKNNLSNKANTATDAPSKHSLILWIQATYEDVDVMPTREGLDLTEKTRVFLESCVETARAYVGDFEEEVLSSIGSITDWMSIGDTLENNTLIGFKEVTVKGEVMPLTIKFNPKRYFWTKNNQNGYYNSGGESCIILVGSSLIIYSKNVFRDNMGLGLKNDYPDLESDIVGLKKKVVINGESSQLGDVSISYPMMKAILSKGGRVYYANGPSKANPEHLNTLGDGIFLVKDASFYNRMGNLSSQDVAEGADRMIKMLATLGIKVVKIKKPKVATSKHKSRSQGANYYKNIPAFKIRDSALEKSEGENPYRIVGSPGMSDSHAIVSSAIGEDYSGIVVVIPDLRSDKKKASPFMWQIEKLYAVMGSVRVYGVSEKYVKRLKKAKVIHLDDVEDYVISLRKRVENSPFIRRKRAFNLGYLSVETINSTALREVSGQTIPSYDGIISEIFSLTSSRSLSIQSGSLAFYLGKRYIEEVVQVYVNRDLSQGGDGNHLLISRRKAKKIGEMALRKVLNMIEKNPLIVFLSSGAASGYYGSNESREIICRVLSDHLSSD